MKKNKQKGLSTLEYCAVAAIIITITWFGMRQFGVGLSGYLNAIAGWTTSEAEYINNGNYSRP